ncbi:hypothetical protein G7046_g2160 [Stylonectria norvegica]|nr:hypothetical protein G7046_g2160 [Stylonectria norvegica]
MAPAKRAGKPKAKAIKSTPYDKSPLGPFKTPPEVLRPFISGLSEKHVYITHIDSSLPDLKRKIFMVPVAMNVCVAILFVARMYWILPWYWQLLMSSKDAAPPSWSDGRWEVVRRVVNMFVDFLLFVFVWPWPVEFALGQAHGSPCQWRWHIGFRPKEIYVRRSREWDQALRDILKDEGSRNILLAYIETATSPLLQEQKTGYLLMNGSWDLDWAEMIHAHALVDYKKIALEAFRNVILVHHKDYGWLCHDIKTHAVAEEDHRRRQVFAFRDTLAERDKEHLFYRWVEMVQFEATQPGGFGPEKQEVAAKKIRELFESEDIDFDALWKESIGTEDFIVR